ncbi:DUF3592 domain-containing protein [Spirosoma aerolatum]|uniref:DUF3592 domain-containing protein n=1 Tax=Spirosoma aerolatum TaxID=1211326 RepID=UPI0009AF0FEF|nr:DUF3592 domain-containing protein [Spirosoma aerolatum]
MKLPMVDLLILLFFLIGVLLVGIAGYLYYDHQQLVKKGVMTKGVVMSMHRIKPREYPVAPSVRYRIQDGRELLFHSSEGRNPPAYSIGQEVTLYYDPAKPERVQLDGDYLLVYVMAGIGAVFLLLSVWTIGESVAAIWEWLVAG